MPELMSSAAAPGRSAKDPSTGGPHASRVGAAPRARLFSTRPHRRVAPISDASRRSGHSLTAQLSGRTLGSPRRPRPRPLPRPAGLQPCAPQASARSGQSSAKGRGSGAPGRLRPGADPRCLGREREPRVGPKDRFKSPKQQQQKTPHDNKETRSSRDPAVSARARAASESRAARALGPRPAGAPAPTPPPVPTRPSASPSPDARRPGQRPRRPAGDPAPLDSPV